MRRCWRHGLVVLNALEQLLSALWDKDGRPDRPDEGDDVLGVLIRMMIAQATSKPNALQAFGNLLDSFEGDWGRIAQAPTADVADAIAIAGLSNQKAPRIQAVLQRAHQDFGAYSLQALGDMTPEDAVAYALALPGVGPTTARFALMLAARMDLFPINTGIRRVLTRYGVFDGAESDRQAHAIAANLLPVDWGYPAHMTLVRHARTTCKKTPACAQCAAQSSCAWARARTK